MCGITGLVNFTGKVHICNSLIKRMCDVISHRGPDDEGCYIFDNQIALGHRRLSIIDISGGIQPMANVKNTIIISFNGEIYNFRELKKDLVSKGYRFKSNSDTEVIINLYEEYGEKSFEKLNGIFAFAIFDKRINCLFLVRDPFGVKPLYYFIDSDILAFGSEVKSILEIPEFKRELNYDAIDSFLTFRFNPSPQYLIKGIKKLPAGHFIKVGMDGKHSLMSYVFRGILINENIGEVEAIEEYQRLLENAVKRQMISDVPVGLLLSGGIDSAIIGLLMQKHSIDKIKTFTVGFEGTGDFNEMNDARETADYIKSEHKELIISQKQYLEFFFNSFHYTEEPIAEATIPALFYVTKLASQELKVVLAGQGADEPLAGYKRYYGAQKLSQYYSLLKLLPFDKIAKVFPRNEKLQRFKYAINYRQELNRFLAIYTIFNPINKRALYKNSIIQNEIKDLRLVESLYNDVADQKDHLAKMLYIDVRMLLPDNLLLFGDKVSMSNSLEMRVPFLDIELVKFLETLPSKYKLRGNVHKYLHKKAVKRWLPDRIIYRKKRAFATPMDNWLQSSLAKTARSILNKKDSISGELFNMGYINNLIDDHYNRRANYQKHIFSLLSFEVWYKSFFENKSLEDFLI